MSEGTRRARIAIRYYRGDRLRHVYFANDLAGTSWGLLRPVCFEPLLRKPTHPSDMVDSEQFRELGNGFSRCIVCAFWLGGHPHEILVSGDIVRIHDMLPPRTEADCRTPVDAAVPTVAPLAA
ncbi:hypothetical protein [Amycolatopsis sp. cmx-4-61]|uniref:hypothetical protein n=1 Tax=Amycolatopsis sp. cmx-4-61 TaxID=2790937 RepID=UPI00397CADCE